MGSLCVYASSLRGGRLPLQGGTQIERRYFCNSPAVWTRWEMIGGFCGVVLPSAQRSRPLIRRETRFERRFWEPFSGPFLSRYLFTNEASWAPQFDVRSAQEPARQEHGLVEKHGTCQNHQNSGKYPSLNIIHKGTASSTKPMCSNFRRTRSEHNVIGRRTWTQRRVEEGNRGGRNSRHVLGKTKYSVSPVLRDAWFQSDGRRVWTSVEMVRSPPKRRDPKGRNVWDFTCNREAAVLAQACAFVFVRTTGNKEKTIGTVAYTRNTFSRVAQGDWLCHLWTLCLSEIGQCSRSVRSLLVVVTCTTSASTRRATVSITSCTASHTSIPCRCVHSIAPATKLNSLAAWPSRVRSQNGRDSTCCGFGCISANAQQERLHLGRIGHSTSISPPCDCCYGTCVKCTKRGSNTRQRLWFYRDSAASRRHSSGCNFGENFAKIMDTPMRGKMANTTSYWRWPKISCKSHTYVPLVVSGLLSEASSSSSAGVPVEPPMLETGDQDVTPAQRETRCEICRRTTKEPHAPRRKVHMILSDTKDPQRRRQIAQQSLVCSRWQDLAALCVQSDQSETKTSQETRRRSQKFLDPESSPKVIYTDISHEFRKACEDLQWDHCASTPHRCAMDGFLCRLARRLKESTSAILLQFGPDGKWLADSTEWYCHLRNVQDVPSDGKLHSNGDSENHLLGQLNLSDQRLNIFRCPQKIGDAPPVWQECLLRHVHGMCFKCGEKSGKRDILVVADCGWLHFICCVGSAFDDSSKSEGGLIAGGVRVRQGRQPNDLTAVEPMNITMLTPRVEAC